MLRTLYLEGVNRLRKIVLQQFNIYIFRNATDGKKEVWRGDKYAQTEHKMN